MYLVIVKQEPCRLYGRCTTSHFLETGYELEKFVHDLHNANERLPEQERPKIWMFDLSGLPQVKDIQCVVQIETSDPDDNDE